MSGDSGSTQVPRPEIGLCSACTHAAVQRNAKASEFWRCRAADDDPTLLKYPPLPVRDCKAFEASAAEAAEGGRGPAE